MREQENIMIHPHLIVQLLFLMVMFLLFLMFDGKSTNKYHFLMNKEESTTVDFGNRKQGMKVFPIHHSQNSTPKAIEFFMNLEFPSVRQYLAGHLKNP